VEETWYSVVQARNFETKSDEGVRERGRYLLWAEEIEFHLLLKCPERQRWRERASKQQIGTNQRGNSSQ
jgi:hypothetical protein